MSLFQESQGSQVSLSHALGTWFFFFFFLGTTFISPVTALEFPRYRELKTFTTIEATDPKFNPSGSQKLMSISQV